MPLQVVCPGCSAKLKAPDTAAGKKTKCPKCQAVISVPIAAPQAPAASSGIKKAENWHMQTTDGSQFGPVPKSELDEWFKEGRISADCQLLKEGADQWQWASEIYPSLEQPASISTPAKSASGFDFLGPATSTNNNDPLGLGNTGLTAASQPLAPLQSLAPSPAFPSYQPPTYPATAPSYGAFPSSGAVNPYSSPAPTYSPYNYNQRFGGTGRVGLPWDVREQSLGTWWETLTSILGRPGEAFRAMHVSGGLGRPIMYAMIGLGIGQLGMLLLRLALLAVAAAGGAKFELVALQMGFNVVGAIIGTVLGATVGCFISSAILHVCLLMVGGEKNGYEATFRVCAYSVGTFGTFQIVPILGPCVAFIWQIVVTIIGLAEAHETSGGKAALAYFIPLITCFACLVIGGIAFGAMIFTALSQQQFLAN
jgi:hypothetical protein